MKDLNVNPVLPYGDNEFDAVTIAVSVDYLSQPLEVFKEMNRVLKPGGVAYMSFSNRCFPTKVVSSHFLPLSGVFAWRFRSFSLTFARSKGRRNVAGDE